jgi:arylsulfatase A
MKNRTYFTVGIGCVLLALFSFMFNSNSQNEKLLKPSKPNIIYILADDLGYGDLGCYGQKMIQTPNLDQMAADGIKFTNHYAGSSVCAPSRCALMTGRCIGRARVRGNYETGTHGFGAGLELTQDDLTVAEILKKANYNTAIIGKWGLGVEGTSGEPNKKGFDYSYGFLNQGHAHYQFPDYLFRNGKKESIDANTNGKKEAFSNDIFTNEALTYIEKNKEKPFFLYLPFTTPHAELLVPDDEIFRSYKGKFKEKPFIGSKQGGDKSGFGAYGTQEHPMAAYAASITHLDKCVGQILQKLKDLGIEENTIIMFSSDNGSHKEGGANPDFFNSSGGLRGAKRDLYEGGIRVPFIVRWKKHIQPKSISDHVSVFWDLLPTLADLSKTDLSDIQTEGISFLPTLLNQSQKQAQHNYLYWEFHENPSTEQAVRMGKWKAVRHSPTEKIELYDVTKDLSETKNIASQKPEVIEEIAQILNIARTPHPIWSIKTKQQNHK